MAERDLDAQQLRGQHLSFTLVCRGYLALLAAPLGLLRKFFFGPPALLRSQVWQMSDVGTRSSVSHTCVV